METSMQTCIDNCISCRLVCLETAKYLANQEGDYNGHIKLLEDCAQICLTCASFMQRDSVLHTKICALCAEICGRCADECEKMTGNEHMKKCAEVCRRCEVSCRHMAGL